MTVQSVLLQIGLAFFGLAALYLVSSDKPRHRYFAPAFGLCAEALWFYYAVTAHAWGILVLSIAYSIVWFRAARIQWKKS